MLNLTTSQVVATVMGKGLKRCRGAAYDNEEIKWVIQEIIDCSSIFRGSFKEGTCHYS